jgi:hypothetical protein
MPDRAPMVWDYGDAPSHGPPADSRFDCVAEGGAGEGGTAFAQLGGCLSEVFTEH